MSHGYYFKKTASDKDINTVKNMNNKTSLIFNQKQLESIRIY